MELVLVELQELELVIVKVGGLELFVILQLVTQSTSAQVMALVILLITVFALVIELNPTALNAHQIDMALTVLCVQAVNMVLVRMA